MKEPLRERGFSLVELMVVVIVLMIMTLAIVPQFGGTYRGEALRSAGRELASVVQLASSQAVISGRAHRLRLDPRSGRFWIVAAADEGEAGFAAAQGLPGGSGEVDPRIQVTLGRLMPAGEGEEDSPGEAGPPVAVPPPVEAAETFGSQDDDLAPAIEFRPDGTSEDRVVQLSDQDGFVLALRIHAATSRVRLRSHGRRGPE